MSKQAFACEADALDAVKRFSKKLKYHDVDYTIELKKLYAKKGRPTKKTESVGEEWYICGSIKEDEKAVELAKNRKGIFIIATNQLDRNEISNESLF